MREESEPNYRAWLLILIFIGAIGFFIYPVLTQTPEGYYKGADGKLSKIPEGWVLASNGTPVPLVFPTPIVIFRNITITPTPDNGIYYASENENGTRKLGRYFVYHRNDVDGKKDLDVHVTVYGYKILDSYHYWELSDNKYYEVLPTAINSKFLFIYVQLYLDDISGKDVRPWLVDENHFAIYSRGIYYQPINFNQEFRIYELENTYTKNDDGRIQYYGQWVKQALTGKDAGKPISIEHLYSYGGISNAVDGYIVYEIPNEDEPKDIQVIGTFYDFGYSYWVLKT